MPTKGLALKCLSAELRTPCLQEVIVFFFNAKVTYNLIGVVAQALHLVSQASGT